MLIYQIINTSSVILQIDSESKNENNYINITSNIINSETELQQNDLVDKFSETNELLTSRVSDEYLVIYFNKSQNYKYNYLLISVKINIFKEYYEPKYFNIYIGELIHNIIDLKNNYTWDVFLQNEKK